MTGRTMTGRTMTRVSDPRHAKGCRLARWRWAAWLVAPIVLVGVGASCASSETVDRLAIVNGTPFDVEVKVSDAKKESWLILGRADHESSAVSELVTDMGTTWVFQFEYGGRVVGDLTVSRAELERNGWRIEVPSRVADAMRRLGFEPPPDG